MREISEGVARTFRARVEFQYDHFTPVTVNDPDLAHLVVPALEKVLGKDHVIQTPPVLGAEDFAYFANEIPGFYFWTGVRRPGDPLIRGLHTPEFDIDERSIPVAIRAMTTLVETWFKAQSSP